MDDATFVVRLAGGELGQKAKYLLPSFQRHEDSDLVGVMYEDEVGAVPDEQMDEFRRHTSDIVVVPDRPDIDFGPLMQLHGLDEALSSIDSEWVVSIDTDLLFVKPFDADPPADADIAVTSMDLGNKYWGWEESIDGWEHLHEQFSTPMPDYTTETHADRYTPVHPLYSTGVVAVRREVATEFVPRWKRAVVEVYGELSEVFGRFNDWFSEQVMFDVLSTDYTVHELSTDYNFQLSTHAYVPASARVLHCSDFTRYRTPMHPSVRREVRRSGVMAESPRVGLLHSLYSPMKIWLQSMWLQYVKGK